MLGEGNTKFSLGAQTQIVTEAFWVSICDGQPDQVQTSSRQDALPNLDVTHLSEEDQDELRMLSRGGGGQDCGCFHCLARPHLENKKKELWESE